MTKSRDVQPRILYPTRLAFKIEGEIRPIPRHIIIKMAKFKDKKRILKAAREKQIVTYKGAPIRLSSDFSTETFQARRE